MGLSSVRVDTGGGGCVQTKMRFFTIFGGESRGMRGEIAGDILPAVKSCRDGTDRDLRFWIFNFGCVKSGEPLGSRDEGPIMFFGTSVFAATQLRRDRKVPSSD